MTANGLLLIAKAKGIAKEYGIPSIVVVVLAVLVGARDVLALDSRVEIVEDKVIKLEVVAKFMGCVMKAQSEGVDPKPCDSHLTQDLVEYLKPPPQ